MRISTYILIAFVFICYSVAGQDRYTISGYIKDESNGESLIGANVFVKDILKGTVTNEYGFYSLTLPEGEYMLAISYLGYVPMEFSINLKADTLINIEIQSEAILANEVVISGERKDRNVESTEMGTFELQVEQVKALPTLLGEVDILKTIQLLPGVQSSGEGNSGFYVRGGGPDQNLILLDEAVVYNPGHLFGFFSIFNADAIKNTKLIKGGMPASYGGRLSSVLDISMKEGNSKQFQMDGGLGIISSRLTLQGPFKKDKASYIISARRTFVDLLLLPILPSISDGDFVGNSYYFLDLNAKVNYKFSDKDRLYISGYFGRDVFKFQSPEDEFNVRIPWGNGTATLRWNHLFSKKMFMNVAFIFNDFKFGFESNFNNFQFSLSSGIRDYGGKIDIDYFPHINHKVKFGVNYAFHRFTPYTATARTGENDFSTDPRSTKYAHETAFYIQDDFNLTAALKANIGLRATYFQQVGPYTQYILDDLTRPIDTINYGRSEPIQGYWSVEPRVAFRYAINERVSLKASLTMSTQYLHMVSNSTTTLPTDLWVPSTGKVKPQKGILYAIGYFQNYRNNEYETSVELYYKHMRNQIEFNQSYVPELDVDIEESFVFGTGYSYGAEFFVKKATGKLTGWIGYTLAFTNKKFPDLNNGEMFPATYDRRHDLEIVLLYEISPRWKLSATFVYGTGQTLTLPTGRYFIDGRVVNQYTERNGFRMQPYHRLDIGATYKLRNKKKKRLQSEVSISIYNAYNRKNPFFLYFASEGNINEGTVKIQAKKVSLFPILPSLTWNFKFIR